MLSHTCPVCRTKMDLDAIIRSATEDAEARRLIEYLVLHHQPTVGAAVMRYLRLFTPPKNRLSWRRARTIIGEIVEALKAHKIARGGREWRVTVDDFDAAFKSVFMAVEKGSVELPLPNNNYLWEVLRSRTNRAEAREEQQRIEQARHAPRTGTAKGARPIADLVPTTDPASAPPRAAPAAVPAPKAGISPAVREAQEAIARHQARRERLLQRANGAASGEEGPTDA